MSEEKIFYATGRRKTSTARVFLKPGSGKFKINGKAPENYLFKPTSHMLLKQAFDLTKTFGKFDAYITVKGGGESGQIGAIRLGTARALILHDPELRPTLKKAGLLRRDPRMVERKKYGLHKARKSTQFSKR